MLGRRRWCSSGCVAAANIPQKGRPPRPVIWLVLAPFDSSVLPRLSRQHGGWAVGGSVGRSRHTEQSWWTAEPPPTRRSWSTPCSPFSWRWWIRRQCRPRHWDFLGLRGYSIQSSGPIRWERRGSNIGKRQRSPSFGSQWCCTYTKTMQRSRRSLLSNYWNATCTWTELTLLWMHSSQDVIGCLPQPRPCK